MDAYTIGYIDTEGQEDFIEVQGEDVADAEEAARGELSAEHPNVDTDEWDIVSCEPLPTTSPRA